MAEQTPVVLEDIEYPESDGQPMAETEHQLWPLMYAIEALKLHFQARPDVYVVGNMFLYYQQGNRRAVVAPDCFVVFGVSTRKRRIYKLWEEGKAPSFVLEITSDSTRSEDQVTKRRLYASLGVEEYFLYDPTDDYLKPPLQGLRLVNGEYEPLVTQSVNGALSVYSQGLGLEMRAYPGREEFRFIDPATGRALPSYAEARQQAADARRQAADAQRQAAEAQRVASEEAARRQAVEAEVERLRAELARLRGGQD